jgi:ribonuclease P protein component
MRINTPESSYSSDNRLKKADEFSSVFIFRKVLHGSYLKIHYKPNALRHSRLGLIVSKRINKRANKRNYMKRLLRELFRQEQLAWDYYDIVVRVQKCFVHMDYTAVRNEFVQLTKGRFQFKKTL